MCLYVGIFENTRQKKIHPMSSTLCIFHSVLISQHLACSRCSVNIGIELIFNYLIEIHFEKPENNLLSLKIVHTFFLL